MAFNVIFNGKHENYLKLNLIKTKQNPIKSKHFPNKSSNAHNFWTNPMKQDQCRLLLIKFPMFCMCKASCDETLIKGHAVFFMLTQRKWSSSTVFVFLVLAKMKCVLSAHSFRVSRVSEDEMRHVIAALNMMSSVCIIWWAVSLCCFYASSWLNTMDQPN